MHQGQFKAKNPKKYLGDYSNIYYRSSWEFSVMMWCDSNQAVTEWSSEELVIPYVCPTDNNIHRYFVDFTIKIGDKTYWIELKPAAQTELPKKSTKASKRQQKRYITEVFQYVKNQAKWKAANEHAKRKNAIFQVWTENTLKQLGIKILGK